MPMFQTGCETEIHTEIWLTVNCFDLCKNSDFTYMKNTKSDVIRRVMSWQYLQSELSNYCYVLNIFLVLTILPRLKT